MSAKTNVLDPNGIVIATDAGVLDPKATNYGRQDDTKRDSVTWTGNAADIIANQRCVTCTVANADATKLNVHLQFITKNGLTIFPKIATANAPAAAAALNGGVYYDTTTNKLRVCANGAYVDLH